MSNNQKQEKLDKRAARLRDNLQKRKALKKEQSKKDKDDGKSENG